MSNSKNDFTVRLFNPIISSRLYDDIEKQILSPLSFLREFGDKWLVEFDLPLVNKKDIKISFDENSVTVMAKLKEIYFEEKLGVKTNFEFFKKTLTLPGNISSKKIVAKFNKGRLSITIPKAISRNKIKVD